ncbi:MAG: hypothetical protein LLG06_00430 [Desulfobacteraceae bacterium]|nr:hypothetical protein [Desulfobacteraceae bacterium]
MAARLDQIGKAGRVDSNGKLPQARATAQKSQQKVNVFQTLLNNLKSAEKTQTGTVFQNRPATANIINSDRPKTPRGVNPVQSQTRQGVNNLATSSLFAMAALSSGPNRLNGMYAKNGGVIGRTGGMGASPSGTADPARMIVRRGGRQIGALSEHFESGDKGPDVIGYDSSGGTSYGTYQISSRAGTMREFIEYLADKAPDMASKLKAAGPFNTGGRSGKMPAVWKKLSTEDPERFSKLQYDFIEKTHYLPALQDVSERTGLDVSRAPKALQEVLWSTAVQHGPRGAAKIFSRAVEKSQTKTGVQLAQLIGSVYDMRAGQFGSSSPETRSAVKNRFKEEGRLALAMLSDPFLKSDGMRA